MLYLLLKFKSPYITMHWTDRLAIGRPSSVLGRSIQLETTQTIEELRKLFFYSFL